MQKIYQTENVYDAAQKRIKYIFDEFDNVLVAFSGGKDSSMLLNLCYDYAKSNNLLNKLSMYHLDYEAQYQGTTDYIFWAFTEGFKGARKYWICLPIAAQCSVNMQQSYWVPWEESKQYIWVREMPKFACVINEHNVPFNFTAGDEDYIVQDNFDKWFSESFGKTAVAVGIRSDESLNRYRAIASDKKVGSYNNMHWINRYTGKYAVAYPIYDWTVEDIWIAHGKFGYKYNHLYDLYYEANVPLHSMRVASPFNDCASESLKLYKAIDPNTWAKMIGRVNGVNFAGIYGGTTAMGWKSIKLPPGHTWKSYLGFLLSTLPEHTRKSYLEKFDTSIKFWQKKGGVLDNQTIKELRELGIKLKVYNETNYNTSKKPVTFNEYPDDCDVTDFKSVPSYKRMCVCIMKNDHLCKYMGFSQTKSETLRRQATIEKYKNIARGILNNG